MILVITGHVGAGKTTAAGFLKELGWRLISVDELAHNILEEPLVKEQLKKHFGPSIIDKKNMVDRKRLGDIVFNDQEKLKMLNSFVHPLLIKSIEELLNCMSPRPAEKEKINTRKKGDVIEGASTSNKRNNADMEDNVVIDAAIFYELGLDKYADKIILIDADFDVVCKRLKSVFTPEKIKNIINNQQLPVAPDAVIVNNGTIEELRLKIRNAVSSFGLKDSNFKNEEC
ncbi:MAG: dephospho-CoA kinase [Candidatus Woesearchaeota archaeon]